eukprot:CAMPEP_0114386650 /NCGR_PEP_ID=MMETSP0102-20121206/6759_1 /TAXON_ID=38822 ORGANISM="Pteridomonas danica, Strain PT" /NCGR_SAMPLE_ID=MMETSP0102 /ASSEMBLY_ACC=CAM_ASM_000212 /LENGTH=145 /DNA_ID=CAMNT_0001543539 /DNA_START=773 /DNA_END=1210 /DNA_ORIENTATION=+
MTSISVDPSLALPPESPLTPPVDTKLNLFGEVEQDNTGGGGDSGDNLDALYEKMEQKTTQLKKEEKDKDNSSSVEQVQQSEKRASTSSTQGVAAEREVEVESQVEVEPVGVVHPELNNPDLPTTTTTETVVTLADNRIIFNRSDK